MYLIDTNVISEARKNTKANPGVTGFFKEVAAAEEAVFISSVSVGELRRGVELIRYRGDIDQALMLERWLSVVLEQFEGYVLSFDADAAQLWGRLRVPHPENELDKQIAAIALINDLTLVTRNMADFNGTGVRLKNPFFPSSLGL